MTDRHADPDLARHLALRAATAPPQEALGAWRELVDRFDLADLWDPEVYRLLPRVWRRLGDDVGPEHADRLKGLYRKAWVTNEHLLRRGGEVVTALRAEGVDPLVVSGLPLGLVFYGDLGTCPMEHVDLLVAPAEAVATWRRLEALGYRARPVPVRVPSSWRRERDDAWFLRLGHPRSFEHGPLDAVAVHTTLSPELVTADPTVADLSDLRDQAVELGLGSVAARTLSPTDHLVHALLPGWAPERTSGLRRFADALVILDSAGDRIDWSELEATARRHRCSLAVAAALDDLRRQWGAAVPPGVHEALADPRPDRRQRTAAWLRRPPRPAPTAAEYVTSTRGLGPWATVAAAPAFLADRWHLDHRRHLPLVMAQRLRHHLHRGR